MFDHLRRLSRYKWIPPKGALAPPRLVSLWETKSLRDRNIPMIWNVAPSRGINTASAECARKFPQEFQQSAPVPLGNDRNLFMSLP